MGQPIPPLLTAMGRKAPPTLGRGTELALWPAPPLCAVPPSPPQAAPRGGMGNEGRAQQGSPAPGVTARTPRHIPGGRSTSWAAMAGGEGSPCRAGSAGHHPTGSSGHCPSGPAAHLLRRMILNSGLCRLVTDTYGSSNSCSFRTTAGKQQLSSSSGQREATGPPAARGSPLGAPTQGKHRTPALGQGAGQTSHRSPRGAPACSTHRKKLRPWSLSPGRG